MRATVCKPDPTSSPQIGPMNPCFSHTAARFSVIVILTACATGGGDLSITDSAGVRIVTNHVTGSGWTSTTPWTVVEDLVIGSDSAVEYQFGRIGDLAVSEQGHIAVIDQLGGVVRVYDASGRHVRSLGRTGRGPGELSRSANGIYFLGADSLLVLDPGERRFTVFAGDGTVDTVVPLPPTPIGQGWSRLPGGDFLMRGLTIGRSEGRFTFWDALLRVAADGASSDTLFEFDYARTDLGGPGNLRIQLIVNNPTWTRLGGGRIAWTSLDRDFVQVHDSTGRVAARIRSSQWVAREVTDADKAAMVELLRTKLQAIGGDASFADSPQVEAPPRFPAITTVRAGPDNTIWVQRMGPVESIDPMAINAPDRADFLGGSTWHVLDSSGAFIGAIELPGRFRIFRVVGDAIYGAARDDDGVERIVRLKVQR